MKKFKRGFSIVEVVVSMAMILIISLSAFTACIACSSVIYNAKNSSQIISYSQTSIQCFNASVTENDVLLTFQNQINLCFGDKVLVTKTGDLSQEDGVTFNLSFDCGSINILIIRLDSNLQISLNSYTSNSTNTVYDYSRSYNIE